MGTTGSSERQESSIWSRPDMEEQYPTMISSSGQAVERSFQTLSMATDLSPTLNSSASVQDSYRITPQLTPPVTPSPEASNSAVWSWSTTARVPQMQSVLPHSSISSNPMWPPKPPPSFFRKHLWTLAVIVVVSILILFSITGFFLLQKSQSQPPKQPAHLVVSPSTLDFGKLPQGVKAVLAITIRNTGEQQLNWTVDTGSSQWLTVQNRTAVIASGNSQQSDNVTIDTSHLPLGVNSAQLTIRSNGGNTPVMVKVVVISQSAKKQPKLDLSASSFNLGTLAAGTQMALSETVSNIGTQTLIWKVSPSNVGWLSLYNTNGTIPSGGQPETITIDVNTTGLTAGSSYQTTFNITSNGGSQKVLINLTIPSLATATPPPVTQTAVTQPPNPPSPTVPPALLSVSSTSLTFGPMQANTAQTQHVTLSNIGGMPLSWSANSNQSWLTTNLTTGTVQSGTQQSVRVTVNTAGLAANTYSATLNITSSGGDQPIAVTLIVIPPPNLCNLSPGSTLTFGPVQQGQNAPPSQSLTFNNCGGGLLNWNASGNMAWVSLSPSSGSINSNQQGSLQVTVDTSQLQPGSYTATITFSTNEPNSGNEQVTVSVTVTAPPTPTPTPSPTPLPSPTP